MRTENIRLWNLSALAVFLIILLAACNNHGEKLQKEVQQALIQQKDVTSYRFSGNADIFLGLPVSKSTNPLVAGLASLVKDSSMAWEGISSMEPVRLEASISLTPRGSKQSLELPILLKDNKLYFNIPLLGPADRYYVVDMDKLSETSGKDNPLAPAKLAQTNQISVKILGTLISGIDNNWFKEKKAGSPSGNGDKVIYIDIRDTNQKEIAASILAKFPEVILDLQSAGLITVEQADKYSKLITAELAKKDGLDSKIEKPWSASVSINNAGFISGITLDLDYALTMADGSIQKYSIHLQTNFQDINIAPAFSKEMPAEDKLLDFAELLNQLSPVKP